VQDDANAIAHGCAPLWSLAALIAALAMLGPFSIDTPST
jgi:hypothetical protein